MKLLIHATNFDPISIDFDGFRVVERCILPIIKSNDLKVLIENKKGTNSILTYKLSNYLRNGYRGLLEYDLQIRTPPFTVDKAMMEASKFVYSTIKYQLVKYLGVFNIMYKYYISVEENSKFEDVKCLDRLITKLEYNALSEQGRKASDYGASERLLNYFECQDSFKADRIRSTFDKYEVELFNRITEIISR